MLYLKLHKTENGMVVAMCDEDAIGKTLEDKDIFMDLKRYSGFYKGELLDRKGALRKIREESVYSANVVGREAVDVAIEGGLIKRENVKHIQGVPYAQAYKVNV
jgi:hypothetical protein